MPGCTGPQSRELFQTPRSPFLWTENGSLQWTPTSKEACTMEILATNVRTNLLSVLQPKIVACFCSKEEQCLYNETSTEGNSSLEVSSGSWGWGKWKDAVSVFSPGQDVCREEDGAVVGEWCRGHLGLQTCVKVNFHHCLEHLPFGQA